MITAKKPVLRSSRDRKILLKIQCPVQSRPALIHSYPVSTSHVLYHLVSTRPFRSQSLLVKRNEIATISERKQNF